MRLPIALVLLLSTAWVTLACNEVYDFKTDFTQKSITKCIKPEFTRSIPIPVSGQDDEGQCAFACRGADKCQGFEVSITDCKCNLFVFDKCDHDINVKNNCTRAASIWIRNQPGLPKGDLCPEGYGSRYGSSLYKLVSAENWFVGKTRCSAEKGFTKFADADDRAEVDYMHAMRRNLSPTESFFVGAGRTSSTPMQFHWVGCNKPVAREVWGSGQPTAGQCCTDIWYQHLDGGLDDTNESYEYLNRALCECVNPFF